jgi:hypothetical protein
VKTEAVAEVRQQLDNYRTFKRLSKEWVGLSVKITKLRKKEAKR